MPGEPIESVVGNVWVGRQPSRDTPASGAAALKPRVYETGLRSGGENGEETGVDGERFANPTMFKDRIGGAIGSATYKAQRNVGNYFAHCLGIDVVTGSADPYTHTMTSAGGSIPWLSVWQEVGVASPVKHLFVNTKASKVTWECSQEQKVAHLTTDYMSLNPGRVYTTSPTAVETTSDPYLWTQVTGEARINTVAVAEVNGEVLEVDRKLEGIPGDSVRFIGFAEGLGDIISTFNATVSADTVPLFNQAIYNDAAPAAGTEPVADVVYFAMNTKYTPSGSGAPYTLEIQRPRVEIRTNDLTIAPARDGGSIPISFGGRCVKSGSTPALTVIGKSTTNTAFV